jgi:hypothetical protein
MGMADYILLKRQAGWAVERSGKEFGPFPSWVRAARAAILHAKQTRGPARICVERENGRCYPVRQYDGRRR